MTAPNTIRIDNVEYVRADAVAPPSGDVKIVVLDRGFVYVGSVEIIDDFCIINNAKNIRIWGTTKGLGELIAGPTSSTKWDKSGTVRAPIRAVISLIDASEKWNTI